MKTFKEWLWNREKSQEPQYKDYSAYAAAQRDKEKKQQNKKTGFFSNLFDKKPTPAPAPIAPTPVPTSVPKKTGMDLDDYRRLFNPNYDSAQPAQAEDQAEKKPLQPSPKQVQLSSSPKNPEEYLEEVANKYWRDQDKSLWEIWEKYKQKKTAGNLHDVYYKFAIFGEDTGVPIGIVEEAKKAAIEILEKLGWDAFPNKDEVELGHELHVDKVRFFDGKTAVSGMVRVIAKGFEAGTPSAAREHGWGVIEQAVVIRK